MQLSKARISIDGQTVEPSTLLCAEILASLEAHSVHKFILECTSEDGEEAGPPLLLWIFSPEVRITASGLVEQSPGMAMIKLLYRKPEEQDYEDEDVEILSVDAALLQDIRSKLVNSTRVALKQPESFGQWTEGMLQRYEA